MSRLRALAAAAAAGVALSGCANPDAPAPGLASEGTSGNAGEPPAPAPPRLPDQDPASLQATAEAAVERFAAVYTNWDYRTLAVEQHALASISVGAARLQARQAAVSARNQLLARAHVWSRGVILSVSRDRARPGWWVLVTREQTGGSGEYRSLPATLHVTLALAVAVNRGWAVSQWQPQS